MVEARWPDSQPVFRQPMAENGILCRPLYEARDARISILAGVLDPETGYVDADGSDQLAETACRRGGPYVSADLTDWLSRTAAEGLASRPIRSRNAMCSSAQIASQVPSRWNLRKML